MRAIFNLAQRIEIASTFQSEKTADPGLLQKMWRKVQDAHLTLDDVTNEAGLYGSEKAVEAISAIAVTVQELADETEAFDPPLLPAAKRKKALEKLDALPDRLRQDVAPVVKEARKILGIS
ncbi:MAG: hypothetical protein EOO15_21815 [Chitinophagaceae bacterium]|nr:MAG: hypothetical protein EOO15_21815 [Chitinophagaceae bacterium]